MVAAARLRHLNAHIVRVLPTADTQPVRAGGENGLPFERWEVGQHFYTTRRTISDSDISTFVQVAGFQVCSFPARLTSVLAISTRIPFSVYPHTVICLQAENLFADMEYLKSQGHPARMAPGLLTASIADALIVGSGIIEGYAVAMIGIDKLTAKKGVYAGDTISADFKVCSLIVA